LPKNLTRQREFQKYEKDLSKEYMREILLEFTKFHNRYYKSQHGLEAAQWLYKKISDVIEGNSGANDDAKVDVSLRQFQHDWNDQSGFVRFKDQEKIGLVLDYVDSDLTQLIKAYANEYTNLPVYEDICGYA
ncbi:Leucine aminopeptidase 1, partial [Entomortierella lignicola]